MPFRMRSHWRLRPKIVSVVARAHPAALSVT